MCAPSFFSGLSVIFLKDKQTEGKINRGEIFAPFLSLQICTLNRNVKLSSPDHDMPGRISRFNQYVVISSLSLTIMGPSRRMVSNLPKNCSICSHASLICIRIAKPRENTHRWWKEEKSKVSWAQRLDWKTVEKLTHRTGLHFGSNRYGLSESAVTRYDQER